MHLLPHQSSLMQSSPTASFVPPGHFATGNTHIDEFVHAVRLVTPTGVLETPRVPASGAGPDPKRCVPPMAMHFTQL